MTGPDHQIGHVCYKKACYVLTTDKGVSECPLTPGPDGFCTTVLPSGRVIKTEAPNLVITDATSVLAAREKRATDKAGAKAKAKAKGKGGATSKAKAKAKAKAKSTAKSAGSLPQKRAAEAPVAGRTYTVMYYKKDARIGLRQNFDPKRQIASAGGVQYLDVPRESMMDIGRQAKIRMETNQMEEWECRSWMQKVLDDKYPEKLS